MSSDNGSPPNASRCSSAGAVAPLLLPSFKTRRTHLCPPCPPELDRTVHVGRQWSRVERRDVAGHQVNSHPSRRLVNVRFSNRPFGVKHFQTIHQCDVDVARGLVLLFGIGTGAFPSWDSRTRRNNLLVGLAVEERRVQADIRTHLIHRPARDIFPPLGGALVFSYRVHAAAVACSLVQQNSVPSTHMRCMITASRRAKATIAFFIPRRLAICMAHALSQEFF